MPTWTSHDAATPRKCPAKTYENGSTTQLSNHQNGRVKKKFRTEGKNMNTYALTSKSCSANAIEVN